MNPVGGLIVSDPEVMLGKPVVAGTRITDGRFYGA